MSLKERAINSIQVKDGTKGAMQESLSQMVILGKWHRFFAGRIFSRNYLMNRKLAAPNIDFADSELEAFNFYDDNILVISIQAWNAKKIILKFNDAIFFTYN